MTGGYLEKKTPCHHQLHVYSYTNKIKNCTNPYFLFLLFLIGYILRPLYKEECSCWPILQHKCCVNKDTFETACYDNILDDCILELMDPSNLCDNMILIG